MTDTPQSFTTSDGVRLNHTDVGDGPPVVLISGHTAPLSVWDLLVPSLLSAGRRVIAVDRRHTGASEFPDHGKRLSRQGADLHELLVHLGLERPAIVASSMGVSATWAMIDIHGSAHLGPLVFVDQTPRMINDGDWPWGLHSLDWSTLDEFVEVFGTDRWDGTTPFERRADVLPVPEVMPLLTELVALPYPHGEMRPLLRDHAVADWRDVVRRLVPPVLAVGGRHAELWPAEHAVWIGEHAPQGQTLVLEGSGHMPFWTEPELFNKAVVDFLAKGA